MPTTNFWKNKYEQLKKVQESQSKDLKKLKDELLLKEIANLSSSQSKEINEIVEIVKELFSSNKNFENAKEKKASLDESIAQKETEKDNLSTDSEQYKKILAEIEELKKESARINKEIEKLRRENANFKEQLNFSHLSLQEEIEKLRETLENKQLECEENTSWNFAGERRAKNTIDIIKKSDIVDIIDAQEEITRSGSKFATKAKEKILAKAPAELRKNLEELCKLQEHLTQLEMKMQVIEEASQSQLVLMASVIPSQLRNKESDLIEEDNMSIANYERILAERKDFSLSTNHELTELPTKLYHIPTNTVFWTKNTPNINSYAIMSYVWGDLSDKDSLITKEYLLQDKEDSNKFIKKQIGVSEKYNAIGTTKKSLKAWDKAIKTCKLLGVDYLWMDQICIDQFDEQEPSQEVPKMRKYYGNANVTLIAIDISLGSEEVTNERLESEKVLKKVVRSQWFSRSWTFQEGWLSKYTIFMFDNYLVEGSILANRWVLGQPSYSNEATYKNILDKGSRKIATPFGWVHYEKGYNKDDEISFTLSQSLRAIKNRGRSISIDGIYTILGLLPYGDKVVPKYKSWGERYTQQDLKEALFDIMSVALKETGHNEFVAWHGLSNNWLPQIYEEDNSGYPRKTKGGTSIEGAISVISKDIENTNLTNSEIKLTTSKWYIENIKPETNRQEEKDKGSVIDSGACTRKVQLKCNEQSKKVELLSTNEILEKKVKANDIVLLLDKQEWKSNKSFVLIVRKDNNSYQRIGLAEVRENDWNLLQQSGEKEELVIKLDQQQYQAQIQIPPKK